MRALWINTDVRCVCVYICECVKPLHVVLPLPGGKKRGLLTSSWSGLIADQYSVLTSIRLRPAVPEMKKQGNSSV